MTRPRGYQRILFALTLAAALAACTAEEVQDSAARTGLAMARATCHAADNCGVSCPDGLPPDPPTLACRPRPR